MGSKTAIMLWRLQVETPHNPFRYCGEYYDDETDLIYLRNRYYDNQTGRFITEDPIKDGLNWYVYCNGNPVNNIDPWGEYYIKDNKNGTYTLVKDNVFSATFRSITSVYVPSSILSKIETKYFNVVDGNSAITANIGSDMDSFTTEYIAKGLGKTAQKAFSIYNVAQIIYKLNSNLSIVDHDNIAFGLLARAEIGLTSNDRDMLSKKIEKTYGFIDNIDYFHKSMGDIFRDASAYEIDYQLSQSKHPQKDIQKYKKKAYSAFTKMGYKPDVAKGMANEVEGYLKYYDARRNELFSIFKSYIK